MNSNYRPNSNSGIRRSVDGFVSTPSKNPSQRPIHQQSPRQASPIQRPTPPQSQFQGNNYNQRPYTQTSQPQPQKPTIYQQSTFVPHQAVNTYNTNQFPHQNVYQTQIPTPQPEQKRVISDSNATLNSSIFPQNAQYYTKDYQATDSQFVTQQPTQQPTQAYYHQNPSPQNFNQGQQEHQSAQSVIGSGSSISGTILSSSASISSQKIQQPPLEEQDTYSKPYVNSNANSSFQEIDETQGVDRNSKFFPTTGKKMKIRPIPNTVKYNSWFSLEWIIETLKSFFGNSYKG